MKGLVASATAPSGGGGGEQGEAQRPTTIDGLLQMLEDRDREIEAQRGVIDRYASRFGAMSAEGGDVDDDDVVFGVEETGIYGD